MKKVRNTERKIASPISYDTNMQHFPLTIAAVKKIDGYNPQPHIATEYECMLRSFLKICYVQYSEK